MTSAPRSAPNSIVILFILIASYDASQFKCTRVANEDTITVVNKGIEEDEPMIPMVSLWWFNKIQL
jgi:hypothetical protein